MNVDRFSAGTGFPATDGGWHFYIWAHPEDTSRTCIDCGEKEEQ